MASPSKIGTRLKAFAGTEGRGRPRFPVPVGWATGWVQGRAAPWGHRRSWARQVFLRGGAVVERAHCRLLHDKQSRRAWSWELRSWSWQNLRERMEWRQWLLGAASGITLSFFLQIPVLRFSGDSRTAGRRLRRAAKAGPVHVVPRGGGGQHKGARTNAGGAAKTNGGALAGTGGPCRDGRLTDAGGHNGRAERWVTGWSSRGRELPLTGFAARPCAQRRIRPAPRQAPPRASTLGDEKHPGAPAGASIRLHRGTRKRKGEGVKRAPSTGEGPEPTGFRDTTPSAAQGRGSSGRVDRPCQPLGATRPVCTMLLAPRWARHSALATAAVRATLQKPGPYGEARWQRLVQLRAPGHRMAGDVAGARSAPCVVRRQGGARWLMRLFEPGSGADCRTEGRKA